MRPSDRRRELHPTDEAFFNARDLRQTMSLPEVLLWQAIRRNQVDGLGFRRQRPMGPYVADFYCHEALMVVEVDGAHHQEVEQRAHDARRDEWMKSAGLLVLRFTAKQVLHGLSSVLLSISREAAPRRARSPNSSPGVEDSATPSALRRGSMIDAAKANIKP